MNQTNDDNSMVTENDTALPLSSDHDVMVHADNKPEAALTDDELDALTAPEIDVIDIDNIDESDLPAGAYPQSDNTVKVVLKKPLKSAGGEIREIIISQAPSIGDMEKAGGRAALLNMMDTAHMTVLPAITQPQITAGIYKKMLVGSPSDTTSLMVGVNSFFVG